MAISRAVIASGPALGQDLVQLRLRTGKVTQELM